MTDSAAIEGLAAEALPWQLAAEPRAPAAKEKEEKERSESEDEELLNGYPEHGDSSSLSVSNRTGGGFQTSQTQRFVLPDYVTKMRHAP